MVAGKSPGGRSGPPGAHPGGRHAGDSRSGVAGGSHLSPATVARYGGPLPCVIDRCVSAAIRRPRRVGVGVRIGVVKRSAVRTGRLRRSPAVHSRPIDLVVFQEPSQLVLPETSS